MSDWISVEDSLPECRHECTTTGNEISNTVLICDSNNYPSIGFGHIQDDGNWVVYEGEYDFMMPINVTHWKPLPPPPTL